MSSQHASPLTRVMGVRVFAEMEDFIRPILIPRLELPPEVIQDLDRGDQRLLQTVWQHLYEYACTEKMSDADPGVEAEIELRHTAEEEMPEIVLTIYYSPLKRRITADRTNKIAVHGHDAGDRIGLQDIEYIAKIDDQGALRMGLSVCMLMNRSTRRRNYNETQIIKETLKMISPISTIADMPDGMTVRKRASGVTTLINKGSPRQARRLKEQAEAAITPTSSTRVMQASPKRPRSFVSEADHPAYPSKSPRAYATQAEGVHHGMHNGMHEQEWHA